ncbi:MAG: nucleoside deaminase [Oscillospiraceae bacterium]|nr:nucleoside deaminase [Oscillospiraceae bacterium]
MNLALIEARKAYDLNEVPVGAVVVYKDNIIGSGFNKREITNNALAHAEIIAINEACKNLNSWRLIDCDIYITLEPCPMCVGAIINSRIKKIIYGAQDFKSGSLGSVFNIFDFKFNHKPEIISGVLETKSASLLKDFFSKLRLDKLK